MFLGIALFVFSLALLMTGCALLVLGYCKLPGGRMVSLRGSRIAGCVFLAFFPVVFIVHVILSWLQWDLTLSTTPINWLLAVAASIAGTTILFRDGKAPQPHSHRSPTEPSSGVPS